MKFSSNIAIVAAAASFASAQNFAGEPPCAVPCLTSAIVAAGCALEDQACQCSPAGQAALQTAITPCLLTSCSPTDLIAAANAGYALCQAFSSTHINSPATNSLPPTVSTISTTTTPNAVSTTTTSTSTAGSNDATVKTGPPITSSSSGTKTSTVTAVTTSVSKTSSGSTSGSGTATANGVMVTGAAANVERGMGMVGVGLGLGAVGVVLGML